MTVAPGVGQAEVAEVLDVGPVTTEGRARPSASEVGDLAVFVARLAAAGSDEPTSLAASTIQRRLDDGEVPPGLRKLADALVASAAEPPAQRRPAEDPGSVVEAMHSHNLVVLEDFGPAAVARTITALLTDGRRVVVTAAGVPELAAVREALPAPVAGRALHRLPALPPAQLRELRRLLATSTPERQARSAQKLPPAEAVPAVEDVADLCRKTREVIDGSDMIPRLLAGLAPERRDAVTSVARCVDGKLSALRPRAERPWVWALLSDLVHSRHRITFDRMLEDTAQASAALAEAAAGPPVTFTAPVPADAVDLLFRYVEFLAAGGRVRSYFRPALQRETQPVLDQLRVGGRVPETLEDVRQVLQQLEIGERLVRIEAGCAEMGIPAPGDAAGVTELKDTLLQVGAAARSVGALRHDVLFIHPDSPVSVPDVAAAAQFAAAILAYSEHGPGMDAREEIERLATDLAGCATVPTTAPEHEQAVAALRSHDPQSYAAAVEALAAARREAGDEDRRSALLGRLREDVPELAEAWTAAAEEHIPGLGFACFVPMEDLLSGIPPVDSADVVVVLGAARLGVARLLLTAVAPRMVAVVGPGDRPNGSPTLLGTLQKAAALVVRARAGQGRVVQLAASSPAPAVVVRAQAG